MWEAITSIDGKLEKTSTGANEIGRKVVGLRAEELHRGTMVVGESFRTVPCEPVQIDTIECHGIRLSKMLQNQFF